MIRIILLTTCIFGLLHASTLKMNEHKERHKRSYTSEADWARIVPKERLWYGQSTCDDLAATSAYREAEMNVTLVEQHTAARLRWNNDVLHCETDKSIDESRIVLKWDPFLASLAQIWANMCTWGHGYRTIANDCSFDPKTYGQNVYWTTAPWEYAFEVMVNDVVNSWEEIEKPFFNQCEGMCDTSSGMIQSCGHYTQVTDPTITKLGCAFTDECHKCTKIYYQDDTVEGPIDTTYDLFYPDWPTHQAMYVCVYE